MTPGAKLGLAGGLLGLLAIYVIGRNTGKDAPPPQPSLPSPPIAPPSPPTRPFANLPVGAIVTVNTAAGSFSRQIIAKNPPVAAGSSYEPQFLQAMKAGGITLDLTAPNQWKYVADTLAGVPSDPLLVSESMIASRAS